MKHTIDLNHIEPKHDHIHQRLVNWARYVSVRAPAWFTHPMFRNAKTPKTMETDLHVPIPVDQLDGHAIEKAVQALPVPNRDAIRWFYVHCHIVTATAQRRAQGLTHEGLYRVVRDGRQMLVNRDQMVEV